MCLEVRSELRRAKRNIVCYKKMYYYVDSKLIMRSMFQGFAYEIGKTYQKNEKKFVPYLDLPNSRYVGTKKPVIKEQGFHSYVELPRYYSSKKPIHQNSAIFVKCVIPKGSLYYCDLRGERASTAIRIVALVDPKTKKEIEMVKDGRSSTGFLFKEVKK